MPSGMFLGLIAGLMLGSVTSIVTLSYGAGATLSDVALMRGLFGAIVLAVLCRAYGNPVIAPAAAWRYALPLCVIHVALIFGYMGSVQFISPGLAVAIFFTFPVQILIIESIRTRTTPDAVTMLVFALALAGIAFSVGIDLHNLDGRGIALAAMASLGAAANFTIVGIATRKGHALSFLIPPQMAVVAFGILLGFVVAPQVSPLALLGNTDALVLLTIVGLLAGVGLMLAYIGVRSAPPQWVALMMNVEPLMTLTMARVLLDERLSTLQYQGIIVAILAIMFGGYWRSRKRN